MLDGKEVFKKLRKVLTEIQQNSDFEIIEITLDTCPVKDMPMFDSQLWITSITMLGEELDTVIPENTNIFLSDDGKRRLTVKEIIQKVLSTHENK